MNKPIANACLGIRKKMKPRALHVVWENTKKTMFAKNVHQQQHTQNNKVQENQVVNASKDTLELGG